MFGHDDNQQQPATTNNDPLQAAMPDPLNGASLGGAPSTVSPTFTPQISEPVEATQAEESTTPEVPAESTPEPDNSAPSAPLDGNGLGELKQQALQHLSPLVDHLDQSPEEKFRTTMMMIQAADDHSLIRTAFEAAQNITDDKARAQALLDVINEINYFTQLQG